MKRFIFLIPIIFFSVIAIGQTESIPKRRTVYFELAGSGGLGSFNYETVFFSKNAVEYTWRAGLSIAPIDRNNGFGIVFPLMVNTVVGKTAHKLEMGLGQGITITTKGSAFALTTLVVGYRYQPEAKKWFYRISYTPLISYLVDLQMQQWGGISIGYTLKTGSK